MSREASPKVAAYAVLAGFALIAALVTRRAELAALGAPFLLLLGAGFLVTGDLELRARVELDRDRVLEGEELEVEIELTARRTVERAEVLLVLPPGLTVASARTRSPSGSPPAGPAR